MPKFPVIPLSGCPQVIKHGFAPRALADANESCRSTLSTRIIRKNLALKSWNKAEFGGCLWDSERHKQSIRFNSCQRWMWTVGLQNLIHSKCPYLWDASLWGKNKLQRYSFLGAPLYILSLLFLTEDRNAASWRSRFQRSDSNCEKCHNSETRKNE